MAGTVNAQPAKSKKGTPKPTSTASPEDNAGDDSSAPAATKPPEKPTPAAAVPAAARPVHTKAKSEKKTKPSQEPTLPPAETSSESTPAENAGAADAAVSHEEAEMVPPKTFKHEPYYLELGFGNLHKTLSTTDNTAAGADTVTTKTTGWDYDTTRNVDIGLVVFGAANVLRINMHLNQAYRLAYGWLLDQNLEVGSYLRVSGGDSKTITSDSDVTTSTRSRTADAGAYGIYYMPMSSRYWLEFTGGLGMTYNKTANATTHSEATGYTLQLGGYYVTHLKPFHKHVDYVTGLDYQYVRSTTNTDDSSSGTLVPSNQAKLYAHTFTLTIAGFRLH